MGGRLESGGRQLGRWDPEEAVRRRSARRGSECGSRQVNPNLERALERAKYLYVTTYNRAGKSGTVPTWLWPHGGAVYFTTIRTSLKARRIRDTGRVTAHIGTKEGPSFEGRVECV